MVSTLTDVLGVMDGRGQANSRVGEATPMPLQDAMAVPDN
jgi:hypothetical protein